MLTVDDYFSLLCEAIGKLSPEEMREWESNLENAAIDIRMSADEKQERQENPDDDR